MKYRINVFMSVFVSDLPFFDTYGKKIIQEGITSEKQHQN